MPLCCGSAQNQISLHCPDYPAGVLFFFAISAARSARKSPTLQKVGRIKVESLMLTMETSQPQMLLHWDLLYLHGLCSWILLAGPTFRMYGISHSGSGDHHQGTSTFSVVSAYCITCATTYSPCDGRGNMSPWERFPGHMLSKAALWKRMLRLHKVCTGQAGVC